MIDIKDVNVKIWLTPNFWRLFETLKLYNMPFHFLHVEGVSKVKKPIAYSVSNLCERTTEKKKANCQ